LAIIRLAGRPLQFVARVSPVNARLAERLAEPPMTCPASRHSLRRHNGFRRDRKTVGAQAIMSLRQFDKFVYPLDGVVYGYMEHWMGFFDCQGRLFSRFKGRIRRLGLPIHLKAELTLIRLFSLP
jgi:hypothetical protein